MKYFLIISMFLAAVSGFSRTRIKELELDQNSIITIYVGFDKSPCTVLLPSKINGGLALMNAEISDPEKNPEDYRAGFLIDFARNSFFFTVYAIKKESRGTINLVYNKVAYTIDLVETQNNYYSTVTLKPLSGSSSADRSSGRVTDQPTLIGLIQQAKDYHFLKTKNRPVEMTEYYKPENPSVSDYGKFDVLIREVFRYKNRDVLVFNTVFRNRCSQPIRFDPHLVRVVTGSKSIPVRTIKTSRIMPPYSDMVQWFAVSDTGNFTGGKPLSAKNDWTVLVVTDEMKKEIDGNTTSIDQMVDQSTDEILREAYRSEDPEKLKELLQKTRELRNKYRKTESCQNKEK